MQTMHCVLIFASLACFTSIWPAVSASRGRLRTLNELLLESQSVSDLPDFVTNLPAQSANHVRNPLPEMIAPKKKHTREKKLRRILGRDFEEGWMSITEPKVKVNQEKSKQADLELLSELTLVNRSLMVGNNKGLATLTPQVSKVIEKWLLQRASCPVTFVWDDLGDLFWPRWVKRGVCGSGKRDLDLKYGPGFVPRGPAEVKEEYYESSEDEDEEKVNSCSWPAGMHCVPADSHTIRVLRWHCYRRSHHERGNRQEDASRRSDRRRHRKTKMKCVWIKVPYPVTSECFCSC